jgi:hypothetical protein
MRGGGKMKRYWLFGLVSIMLSACSVDIGPRVTVNVTPAPVTLGTTDQQVFTASLSSGTATDFTWTVATGQGQLSPARGASVTYTAPDAVGDYDITVSAIGVEATNAVVKVSVLKKFLASTEPLAVINPVEGDKTLIAKQTKRFIVEIPAQLTQPLLYFELGTATADATAATLVLKNASQQVIAVSSNPRFFSKTATAQSSLEAQAISADVICRGPCVIVKNPGTGRYILEVTATKDMRFDLFAFDDIASDTLEPNDSVCKTAADNSNSSQFVGALETLDDVDCFQSAATVTNVTLSNANVLNPIIPVRAEIRRADNDELLATLNLTPGGPTSVGETRNFGVAVKVLVRGVDVAGPNETSRYTLTFQ